MPTMTIVKTGNADGAVMNGTATQTSTGTIGHSGTITNAGVSGTLNIAGSSAGEEFGTVTLAEGHGFEDDDVVDVYWTGGVCPGMVVSSAGATTITITDADSDTLPVHGTTVVVGKVQEVAFVVNGTNVEGLMASCNKRCHLEFRTAAASSLKWEVTAGGMRDWLYSSGLTNPVTGDNLTHVRVSCGETVAGVLNIECLFDSEA